MRITKNASVSSQNSFKIENQQKCEMWPGCDSLESQKRKNIFLSLFLDRVVVVCLFVSMLLLLLLTVIKTVAELGGSARSGNVMLVSSKPIICSQSTTTQNTFSFLIERFGFVWPRLCSEGSCDSDVNALRSHKENANVTQAITYSQDIHKILHIFGRQHGLSNRSAC